MAGTVNYRHNLAGPRPKRAKKFKTAGISFSVDGYVTRVPKKRWPELARVLEVVIQGGGDAEFNLGIWGVSATLTRVS
jgi:hypothetical protein